MNRYRHSSIDLAANANKHQPLKARQWQYDAPALYLLALMPFGFLLTKDNSPSLITISASLLAVVAASYGVHRLISRSRRR